MKEQCENKIHTAEPGGWDGITLPIVMPFEIEQEPKIVCYFLLKRQNFTKNTMKNF